MLEVRGFSCDNISWKEMMLGNTSFPSAVNMCLIIVKQHIYSKRCRKLPLLVKDIEHIIVENINIEKYYAIKDLVLHKFNRKWNIYDPTIEDVNIDTNM